MKPLSSYIGEDLLLIQPSFFKREYEFRSSDELLAKMYFPSFIKLSAVVEGFGEKYEIIRPSFWKSNIVIKKFGYDMPFASLTTNFFRTKGILDLQNGRTLKLKFGSFKKSCQVFSEMEELLLIFYNKFSIKGKNVVAIQKTSSLLDDNPWVVMMIWYLILERRNNKNAG